ncbi:thermonuclease family protein [uncultured Campylobacter sp.]|uniref:thermonuclease family protein n=1 Tax=uncultured Campylobacter sp. TaxID=218934 RepID=UPI0028EDB55B|nr:thermonuclease family protein [uncultured Campylobacter sp.]
MSITIRLLLISALPISLIAEQNKVVSIHDGDMITVLQGKQQIKVRLFGIDAPELKQPYGKKSKQFLVNLVTGKSCDLLQSKA